MPEVHEGKNLADFIDPDIANRLEELEAEEERLQEEGFYDSDDPEEEEDASDDDAIRQTAAAIRKRRTAIKTESQEKKKQGTKARVPLPRTSGATHRTQSDVTNALKRAGYDTSSLEQRAALTSQARKALRADKRKRDTDDVEMDGSATEGADSSAWADASMDVDDDGAEAGPSKRTKGNTGVAAKKPVKSNKKLAGLRDEAQWDESHKILSMARKERNRLGKAGEADRHGKHLLLRDCVKQRDLLPSEMVQFASRSPSTCSRASVVWAQPTTADFSRRVCKVCVGWPVFLSSLSCIVLFVFSCICISIFVFLLSAKWNQRMLPRLSTCAGPGAVGQTLQLHCGKLKAMPERASLHSTCVHS